MEWVDRVSEGPIQVRDPQPYDAGVGEEPDLAVRGLQHLANVAKPGMTPRRDALDAALAQARQSSAARGDQTGRAVVGEGQPTELKLVGLHDVVLSPSIRVTLEGSR
jgi:hypothetical protein